MSIGKAMGRNPQPCDDAHAPYVDTAVEIVWISQVLMPTMPTRNVPTDLCPWMSTPRVGPGSPVAQFAVWPRSGGMMPLPTHAALVKSALALRPAVVNAAPHTSV